MHDKGSPFFWGKRQDISGHIHWHPLVHHCLEVASVVHALLDTTVLRKRLAMAVDLEDLTHGQMARLAVMAALHDAGKFNLGFQEQYDPQEHNRHRSHGHIREIFKLLMEHPRAEEGYTHMQLEALDSWLRHDDPDELVYWLWAIFCHHGRPLPGDRITSGSPDKRLLDQISPKIWEQNARWDPLSGLKTLISALDTHFPEAFAATTHDQLPISPPMQHLFNGLVTLADWIGSDAERFFPFAADTALPSPAALRHKAHHALHAMGCDVTAARRHILEQDIDSATMFDYPSPNAMQRSVRELPSAASGNITILEAETGSGKTEAALIHFFELFRNGLVDGLYFALPTRAAAVQIHARVNRAVERALGPAHPPVVLAVPGYIQVDAVQGRRLEGFEIHWPEDQKRYRYRGWAAEHPKRYLAATIAVGTVDQALMSALAVSHAHMRATALSRLLLVVDEVHASDAYMTTILREVIARHGAVGGARPAHVGDPRRCHALLSVAWPPDGLSIPFRGVRHTLPAHHLPAWRTKAVAGGLLRQG
ncbi:MAG: CRISPR-associated endonuclease Cas3'' [Magnetococcales bacterium]|nr:CRISPR-associated endonuclease Cas3'' [Magnetococcales bacterium]